MVLLVLGILVLLILILKRKLKTAKKSGRKGQEKKFAINRLLIHSDPNGNLYSVQSNFFSNGYVGGYLPMQVELRLSKLCIVLIKITVLQDSLS